MTTVTMAIPMVVTAIRLVWATRDRRRVTLRERVRTIVPFVLVLFVISVATLGYLELVAALLEILE
ncbi:hypothetical protein [Halostagnicola sp. A-GB9-2]|uniref:hypothetical protein n=1 Tax=Halostagnicola sp. A-GB9-2 TaxID=3048066 RepID=UPI0024C09C4E|nr:hypothetical protein [Halostagnicola sp. A-GB9-2]MDJ1433540.1 hypothetical protein [Halostagnicola sp. A-GB9-2]